MVFSVGSSVAKRIRRWKIWCRRMNELEKKKTEKSRLTEEEALRIEFDNDL